MSADLGEQFRAAMRRFPSTVSVISTAKDGQRHGMTATAVTSVSLDPPSLLVCVNRSGRLFDLMESCRRFCVTCFTQNMSLSHAILPSRIVSIVLPMVTGRIMSTVFPIFAMRRWRSLAANPLRYLTVPIPCSSATLKR